MEILDLLWSLLQGALISYMVAIKEDNVITHQNAAVFSKLALEAVQYYIHCVLLMKNGA